MQCCQRRGDWERFTKQCIVFADTVLCFSPPHDHKAFLLNRSNPSSHAVPYHYAVTTEQATPERTLGSVPYGGFYCRLCLETVLEHSSPAP